MAKVLSTGFSMAKLNAAQQELLDLFSIEYLPHLYWLLNCTSQYKIAKNNSLLANLPDLFMGNLAACDRIEALLQKFKDFPVNHRCTANENDRLFLNKFVNCLEQLIAAVKNSARSFPNLSPDQKLAARWLFGGSLPDLCQNFSEIAHPNKQAHLDLLLLFINAVIGLPNRHAIYYTIIYMWKKAESISDKLSAHNKSIEYSNDLVKELSNASMINKIFTAIIFSIICGIFFPIGHNPLYHFLHLFRNKESKPYHIAHMVIFPVFPLLSMFGGFNLGFDVGYEGSKYWLFYLTKQLHKGILATSFAIIACSIAVALLTVLFPPSIPFLIATLPILAQLSPVLLSIAAGFAACLALTTISAAAVFTYTRCTQTLSLAPNPQTIQHQTPPSPSAEPAADPLRAAALGKLSDFSNVLAPSDAGKTANVPETVATLQISPNMQ